MQEETHSFRFTMDCIIGALVGLVPLVFDSHAMDSFSLPKWAIVMALATLALGATIHHFFASGKIYWKNGSGTAALLGLILTITASTLLAPTRMTAFFGLFAFRMDGLLAWISYGVIFFTGLIYLDSRRLLRAQRLIVIVGGALCLYAFAQYTGHDFVRWTTDPSKNRVWSSFGNPNFLAAYLAMALPLALNLAVHEKRFRIFAGVFLIAGLWVLGLTLCRSAWLGAAVGLACFAAFQKSMWSRINKKVLIGILALAIGAGFILPRAQISQRFETAMKADSSDWLLRQAGWKAAARMAAARPFIGYGADGYHLNFRKYMDISFFRITHRNLMSPVYPHNEILQIAVDGGFLGLACYSAFLVFLVRAGWKKRDDPLWAAVFAALIAVWVNNLFTFHNVSTAVLFFLFAGGLMGAGGAEKGIALPRTDVTASIQNVLRLIVGAAAIAAFFFVTNIYLADRAFKNANTLDEQGRVQNAMMAYNQAIMLNRREPTYLHRFAELGSRMAGQSSNPQERRTWLEATGRFYGNLLRLNPRDAVAHNGRGMIYARLFQEFQMPLAKQAEEEFLAAAELDPQLAEAWTNLGALRFTLNRKQEALESYLHAKDVNPYAPQVYHDLGVFYALQGRFTEAADYWKQALQINPNFAEAQNALQMLASGQLQKMYGGKTK